jgi:hypothetical protein
MKRSLPVFEAGHSPTEHVGVFLDQLANQTAVAESDGREDMVARAALYEQRPDSRRIAAGLAVNGGPPYDVEFMHVPEALDIAAAIEQGANGLDILPRGSPMQRVGVVAGLACVWVRAVFEKHSDSGGVPGFSRSVQPGPSAMLCIGVFRAGQFRIPGQRYAQSVGIAAFALFEEPRDVPGLPLLNFRFQGPPTWKAVISGSGEQSISKLRFGLDPPQLLQSIFRQFS